ncbi:MAG: rod shape-determining protein RodA [Desulfobulbaceae bacterium]|nr:rod shape-determining protein RodA [Desulfobulbaceae bacterium]
MFRFDRRLITNFDWVMLLILIFISAMAMVNLYSSTWRGGPVGSPIFYKQLYMYLVGFALILVIVSFDYSELELFGYIFYVLIILTLAYTTFFVDTVAGTQRWIKLGFFNLQPSEPAKLILVIVLAAHYSNDKVSLQKGYGLLDLLKPALLTMVPFILIFKQPDLGTALMLIILLVSMTLLLKLRKSAIISILATTIPIAFIGWNFLLKAYQKRRILTFLNPEGDKANHGYQIMQSKIAVGSGQSFGKGFLEGTQGHLQFLPERHTDFAFSVWGEEWGFTGCLIFLGCYFFMLAWGILTAITARDKFGMMMAFGLVMLIFWQAVINLFMIMGLLPVVGIPLPLFSYGGSSLLTTIISIGILISIRMRGFPDQSLHHS